MAVRLLDAPGVEIHEIDKSQYTPSMSGTKCYVMGFANKGEPYVPMQFTSKSAWQNFYGEPDNEAERYFYNACSEVINQNGTLYCARLPYDNESMDKMVAFKYKVYANNIETINSFVDVVKKNMNKLKNNDQSKELALTWGLDEYLNDEIIMDLVNQGLSLTSSGFDVNQLFEEDNISAYFTGLAALDTGDLREVEDPSVFAAYNGPISAILEPSIYPTEEEKGLTIKQIIYKRFFEGFLTYDMVKNDKAYEPINRILSSDLTSENYNYHAIKDSDQSLSNYIKIEGTKTPYLENIQLVDEYRTGESLPPNNSFVIVDRTCGTLAKIVEDERKGQERQLIGIFPVVTTAANALYVQNMIDVPDSEAKLYETVRTAVNQEENSLLSSDVVIPFSNDGRDAEDIENNGLLDSVSMEANTLFPSISMNRENTHFDTENLKKIGIVVYKAYLDPSEGNKVNFTPVEAFVGSLCKDDINPNTGVTTFIDTIVNSQSEYVYVFSNCFNTQATRKNYDDECDLFITNPGNTGMLGFFEYQTAENISVNESINKGMQKCFNKVSNIDEMDIDVVCDAGISNIAQYLKTLFGASNPKPYDLTVTDDIGNPLIKMWKCRSASDVKTWKSIVQKFDTFCKNTRKDCMFVCDGPRPLVLQGQKKIVRESKPSNTIDADILPYLKWITGLNTNYGAGYMDWFQIADDFTGDYFWCPPSIKAMGVYVNTDLNFQYWDAPAGLNRGIVQALDVAFSPTNQQAGPIYTKSWNYAIDFPNDGITLWGQRTLQTKPSALDRVNVRRLCLRLERQVYKVSRYFLFEGNTAYTRQRLIDLLDPIFKQAKIGGGLYDYKIICDESNNTPTTIDNNELHLSIGIKPVKTIEFIICNFTILSTGGSWDEME